MTTHAILQSLGLGSNWAPLADHLWQSTLIAGIAGLLTLILRSNSARARYWLWLTASMKFLIPFSLLVGIGSHLGGARSPVIIQTQVLSVMRQISQPFASAAPSHVAHPAPTTLALARTLPVFSLVVWICGAVAVLSLWSLRWRRITAAVRAASPAKAGRELDALRRVERRNGIAVPVELIVSDCALEPGLVGIFRPMMLLPAGISERLTDAQLEAIITHELCHRLHHDNLAASMHMLVEALFWFHPLTWWIGARLVEERERACDEEVLRLGNEPQAYAEGILKVCEFYLESPLFCAAGVTGSNLRKRVEVIMTQSIARKLDFGKKLLFTTIGVAVIAGSIALGLFSPAPGRAQTQYMAANIPAFESVSITPHRLPDKGHWIRLLDHGQLVEVTNFSLLDLVTYAYDLDSSQVSGGPAWSSSERYDISAKGNDPANEAQVRAGFQRVLADRFKLTCHHETKPFPVYELVVGENGPKLHEVRADANDMMKMLTGPPGHLVAAQATMGALARALAGPSGRLVLDKTELKGVYEFTLDWSALSPNEAASLSSAVTNQLGLHLREQTVPVEVLVIDYAEETGQF